MKITFKLALGIFLFLYGAIGLFIIQNGTWSFDHSVYWIFNPVAMAVSPLPAELEVHNLITQLAYYLYPIVMMAIGLFLVITDYQSLHLRGGMK